MRSPLAPTLRTGMLEPAAKAAGGGSIASTPTYESHHSHPPERLLALAALLLSGCAQIQAFHRVDAVETAGFRNRSYEVAHDPTKKTVVLLADITGTEIMDLLAPFGILAESGLLNVYILANREGAVQLWKGLALLPHFTIQNFPFDYDAVVMPNVLTPRDPALVQFIAETSRPVLSVCEGARVVAQSGKFNGAKMATHASLLDELADDYPDIQWQRGVKVVKDGRLLSSAGVASGVEGALTLLRELFDDDVARAVMRNIGYPFSEIRTQYHAETLTSGDKVRILWKTLWDDDPVIGVELHSGVDELHLAALIDGWARTFPARIETVGAGLVETKHGLLVLGHSTPGAYDLLLCLDACRGGSRATRTVTPGEGFVVDAVLRSIEAEYGTRFARIVRRLLDY